MAATLELYFRCYPQRHLILHVKVHSNQTPQLSYDVMKTNSHTGAPSAVNRKQAYLPNFIIVILPVSILTIFVVGMSFCI